MAGAAWTSYGGRPTVVSMCVRGREFYTSKRKLTKASDRGNFLARCSNRSPVAVTETSAKQQGSLECAYAMALSGLISNESEESDDSSASASMDPAKIASAAVRGVGKIIRAKRPVLVVVFVFCMMRLRCSFTVYSLRLRRLAISLLVKPSMR